MDLNSIRATQLLFLIFCHSRDKQAQENKIGILCSRSYWMRIKRIWESCMIHSVWYCQYCHGMSDRFMLIDAWWILIFTRKNEWMYLCACADVFGIHNKWEKCVRPETEQQKSPITIQLERRSGRILSISQQRYIIAIIIHSSPDPLFSLNRDSRVRVPVPLSASSNLLLHISNTTLSCQWHRRQNSFHWPITFCMIDCWKWSSNRWIENVLKTEAFSDRETIIALAVSQYYY